MRLRLARNLQPCTFLLQAYVVFCLGCRLCSSASVNLTEARALEILEQFESSIENYDRAFQLAQWGYETNISDDTLNDATQAEAQLSVRVLSWENDSIFYNTSITLNTVRAVPDLK